MKYLLPLLLVTTMACELPAPAKPDTKHVQAAEAKRAADTIKFDGNAEIDNIKRRLELTSSPDLLGYVVLLNDAGQPIEYTTVKGKLTSGGKRLTAPQELRRLYAGDSGYSYETVDSPSDEGTYGHSGDYIYFWDQNGAYHQWNGTYLYSDQPIRLSVAPLVVSVTETVVPSEAPPPATAPTE